jgi:hypothetical protein
MGYPGYAQSPSGQQANISEQKRKRILAVLDENGGDFSRASAILGISSASLQRLTRGFSGPDQKKKTTLAVLAENGGDFNRASAVLGTNPLSLQRRIREWSVPETDLNPQSATNPTRGFYEKITNKWSITAFDPSSREVCIEIKTPSSTNHLSYTIPSQRIAD